MRKMYLCGYGKACALHDSKGLLMNRADYLAEQIDSLRYADVPTNIVERCKDLLLDQLGCEIAFSGLNWCQAAYRYARHRKSSGNATVFVYGDKMAPEDAAMCNSVFGHGFEMDDTDTWTTSHPGACVIPACLSISEELSLSGKEFITAMIVGYETLMRVGRVGKSMYMRNWHGTAVPGGIGVAAAVSKLLSLDTVGIKAALGIAASHIGGNTAYMYSGGTVKRTLPSVAVSVGMKAAFLSQMGITGPEEPLDGGGNIFTGTCAEDPLYDELLVPFKDNFYTAGVGIKPYCCCQGSHALIDAAADIRNQINGDYTSIKKMTIIFHEREVEILCNIIHPKTVIEAQFSARFAASLRMVKGSNGFNDYNEENLIDKDVNRLIDVCEVQAVPAGTLSEANGPARLVVEMNDGAVYDVTKAYATGSVKYPMSREAVVEKFTSNTLPVLPQSQVDAIVDAVAAIDTATSVEDVTKLLVAGNTYTAS